MRKQNLHRQVSELAQAIDLCFEKGLFLPGLMLVYAGIDAMAWLSKADESAPVSESFQQWTKTYFLTSYGGEVGSSDQLALDLYAARCALLHSQIAESDLSRKAKAREVHYRCSDGSGFVPVEGFNSPQLNIYLDPKWIRRCFLEGVERFTSDVDADPELRARVHERAARYFVPVMIP